MSLLYIGLDLSPMS